MDPITPTPAELAELLAQLRALIGQPVRYQGMDYTIRDVLEAPPMLVLQAADNHTRIQADNYGQPRSLGTGYLDLSILDERGCVSAELRLVTTVQADDATDPA